MESMPVNWEALDALVVDFAKSENLIEDSAVSSSSPSSSSPSSSPSSFSYHSRLLIRQIRRSLEVGDIDVAIDLLRVHAPLILDDHRLLFRLQKQKFIELLRRGTAEDRDSAINCLRTALAPCALDAYPEAYEEFKHVLLAFIFDKDDQNSPVANEVTKECLDKAISICAPGVEYKKIGKIIQDHADRHRYGVVQQFVGHGVGRVFHADPVILHYRNNERGRMMLNQTFTIEPMLTIGSINPIIWDDNWTVVTEDGSLSAQFEHTILITPDGAEILTQC